MSLDKQIFKEDFYKEAVKAYHAAINEAQSSMRGGQLKKDVITGALDQARVMIQEKLDTGYQDLRDKLQRYEKEMIFVAEKNASAKQQDGGATELLRRQDLKAKLSTMEEPDLVTYIQDQTEKDMIPEYDFYIIKQVADQYIDLPNHRGVSLSQAVRKLETKLPANVTKASDQYQKHEAEIAETYNVPTSMLWIDGVPHDVKADFAEVVKGYE